MRIAEAEEILADRDLMVRLSTAVLYAQSRRRGEFGDYTEGPGAGRTPGNGRDAWTADERQESLHVAATVIRSMVDDLTTEGCMCQFCTWTRLGDKPRLIMCTTRWDALSPRARREIAESLDG